MTYAMYDTDRLEEQRAVLAEERDRAAHAEPCALPEFKDQVRAAPEDDLSLVEDPVPAGYEPLHTVLMQALDRAARGKGKERHANGLPFLDQPILQIGKLVGPGFALGQAIKKLGENIPDGPDQKARIRNERLDAIVYIAAAILLDA